MLFGKMNKQIPTATLQFLMESLHRSVEGNRTAENLEQDVHQAGESDD